MSLETLSTSSSYIISKDTRFLNLIIWSSTEIIQVLSDGDIFMEHNWFVYIKLEDWTIKSLHDYLPRKIQHPSLGSWAQAVQLDSHWRLTSVYK